MQDLKVTLIQTNLHWENPQANIGMLEEKIWQIKDAPDLIILPEMFTTGFSMNAATLAEPMNLTTTRWMKQIAAQTKSVITGSFICKEKDNYYNRLLWVEPSGNLDYYDKRHLFRMAGEDKVFSAGGRLIIKEIKGWKICPLICYDLRFPVWSRNIENAYDVLIYIANWPEPRRNAWKALLPARAIENLSYTIGLNRIGQDGKGLNYAGDSGIWDYKGDRLLDIKNNEDIKGFTLNKKLLEEFRSRFPAHLDADRFTISG